MPAPAPIHTQPVTPPAPAPAQHTFAQQPNQEYQPQTAPRQYEQAQAYADHIIEQAQHSIPKLPNAILGQMTIACMSSKGGSGKALWTETLIPTPDGFRRMGDLIEGDYVYDETGKPTLVTHAFDVMHDHECYEILFSNGSTIIADAEHTWPVLLTDGTRSSATTETLRNLPDGTHYDGRAITPNGTHLNHEILAITLINTVPVRCITVAAESHLYLAGETYIPTHNSTTALCLAGTIARASAAANAPKRVVLVDLDTRDGQVGSLISQFMPTALNIRVLPKWDAASVKANLVHDKRMGIDALLAPVRPRNADDVGPEFYRDIIGILQTTHDVVVLDCSVNYLDPLLGVGFAMSDEILFVTTLATTSVQGMARSLTELFADPADGGLGIPREKVGIVANQVINNVGMGRDKLLKAALGAPLIGQIPSDQDAVLIATNSNKMSELLKHPRLGPAYYKLATSCLPGWALVPLTAESAAAAQAAQTADPQQPGKRRLFGR
jgi:MinD-like ATPase involved in chromosome partitioning or flagellar assembly